VTEIEIGSKTVLITFSSQFRFVAPISSVFRANFFLCQSSVFVVNFDYWSNICDGNENWVIKFWTQFPFLYSVFCATQSFLTENLWRNRNWLFFEIANFSTQFHFSGREIIFCLVVSYPEYQNHDELDIEIENDEIDANCDSHSRSKLSIASADSGHHHSSEEMAHKDDTFYPISPKDIKKGTFFLC